MSEPRRAPGDAYELALGRRLRLAAAAITWERLWPALWPALGLLGTFLALALLDLWSWLPGWLHLLFIFVFLGAFGIAVRWGVKSFALPDEDEARRRLERKNALKHRPLTALRDTLASDPTDSPAVTLWQLHRARAAAAVRKLRVGIPEAGLARCDPLGLRAVVVLLLVVGFAAAGLDWPARLARAFTPDLSGNATMSAELDAWIAPPQYTGLPPTLLENVDPPKRLRVATGSTLLARVHGGRSTPELRLDDERVAFERADARTHRLEMTLDHGARLVIAQDRRELGAWPIVVVPDRPPEAEFVEPPSRTVRTALRVEYEATDDYGVIALRLRVRRPEIDKSFELELTVPGISLPQVHETSFHDLTPHPWAGLPVVLEIVAEDAVGQQGVSDPFEMTLPERIFNHPVARAIVEQRKQLSIDPGEREGVAKALDAISALPEHFFDDIVVYMALRSARWRLFHDESEAAIAEVQELLWDTALRIEDGTLSLAERELRLAQQRLMDALASDAPDEELERLIDALQDALDRFLQALAERALEQAQRGELEEFDPNAMLMGSDELRRLIERARELAQSGARDAARDLLAQLQELLENLRSGALMGMPRSGEGMQQALRGLGELMHRQQRLLDQTFRESRRRGQPDMGQSLPDMAQRQEALRRGLGELMRRLGEGMGEIPGALGRAERSMRDARRSLEGGMPGDAVGPQTNALDQLRRGAQAMIDRMMEQMGGVGQGSIGRSPFGQQGLDPLGRRLSGNDGDGGITGGDVEIPDKAATERAREILDELYRRAGQPARPRRELDYIDRLLRRF